MDIFGEGHYSAYHNRRDLDTKVIYAFWHLLHVYCWVQFILFKTVEYMYSVHAFNACSMLSSIDVAELTHSFNTRVSVCQVLELDHVCPGSPSVGPRCLCHTGPEGTGPMCYSCAYTWTGLFPGMIYKGILSGISTRAVNTNFLTISFGDSPM